MQRRLLALGLFIVAFVVAFVIAVVLFSGTLMPAKDKAGAPPPPPQATPAPGGKNEGIGVLVPPKQ
jgi:hypothetical protein